MCLAARTNTQGRVSAAKRCISPLCSSNLQGQPLYSARTALTHGARHVNNRPFPPNPSACTEPSPAGFSSDELWASLVRAWASMDTRGQERVLRAAIQMTPGDPLLEGITVDGNAILELADELGLEPKKKLLS